MTINSSVCAYDNNRNIESIYKATVTDHRHHDSLEKSLVICQTHVLKANKLVFVIGHEANAVDCSTHLDRWWKKFHNQMFCSLCTCVCCGTILVCLDVVAVSHCNIRVTAVNYMCTVWDTLWQYVAIRPPGHHAMFCEPNGYCVFNNAAIATRHALEILGLERVLLVDWDAHHGQGLQYAFYDDPRYGRQPCLTYDNSSFYFLDWSFA